jgi:preprotein translocase subunit YajC
MLNFLTATTDPGAGASLLSMLITFLPMIAIFYFLLIRPENKRKKEAEAMRSAMKKGDKITTIGGIVGTVVDIKEDKIVIETSADQVRIEFCKWALSTNETAEEKAKAEQKRRAEEKAKAKAAKKAKKDQ